MDAASFPRRSGTRFRCDNGCSSCSSVITALRILTKIIEGKLNKQIAGEMGIAEQSAKVHVSILKRLGVVSRT